ncbi:ATP-dependent dethiobiotin synthetase BioD [Rhodococcus spelaei]|uniref:ATP-dependent dethiobiotin synthetase BioD n=1 Tax=Rhodococcus spelaei TaxID=2546320 RepID=A0A541BMZ6_9NOCA|nr:dethiobiotin synthase [Rhodococcus spelaei]TQF73654.1 ATP-dependent dethiobiotin synthetase BioD [Rhodococcus spelaei]
MSILCVTGTSTDVGKTVTTAAIAACALAEGLSVAVCKPAQTGVATGESGDLAEVQRLSGVTTVVELARYPEPLAPDTAARRAGMPLLGIADVVAAVRELDATHDLTLVEGAGGLLVRLGVGGFTLADVAADLCAPMLLVAAAGLGTLNHSALTVAAARQAGVRCAGTVIGSWPAEPDLAMRCNLDDLADVTGIRVLGRIPEGSGRLDRTAFTAEAVHWFDTAVQCWFEAAEPSGETDR